MVKIVHDLTTKLSIINVHGQPNGRGGANVKFGCGVLMDKHV